MKLEWNTVPVRRSVRVFEFFFLCYCTAAARNVYRACVARVHEGSSVCQGTWRTQVPRGIRPAKERIASGLASSSASCYVLMHSTFLVHLPQFCPEKVKIFMPGTSQRTTPAAKISCEHKTRKTRCRLCGGGSICCHNNVRDSCKKCIVQTTIAKHTGQHLPPTSRAKRTQSNDNIQTASCSTATMPLRPVPVLAMAVQIITPMVHKDFEKSHAHYNEFKIRAGQGTF